MKLELKNTQATYYLYDGWVRNVQYVDGSNGPFMSLDFEELGGNEVTLYLSADQAREVAGRILAEIAKAKGE